MINTEWGLGLGDWGLGIGDWGLGVGDWGLAVRSWGWSWSNLSLHLQIVFKVYGYETRIRT